MGNTGATPIIKASTTLDVFRGEPRAPHTDLILPANPLTDMSDESLAAFVDCTIFEDAIPEMLETGNPQEASLERALAAAAGLAVRLDGGTQRIERVKSPLDRARELADEHADSAFGAMFARAAERIVPVADHTVPMMLPPEMLDATLSEETETVAAASVPVASASSVLRPTLLGIVPVSQPRSRAVNPSPRRRR